MPDYTKIINDISRDWKLVDAQYAHDGTDVVFGNHKAGDTRVDKHYPARIGSIYTCLSFIDKGRSVIMPYKKDARGRDKTGYVCTSPLVEVDLPEVVDGCKVRLRFTTMNTIYILESAGE